MKVLPLALALGALAASARADVIELTNGASLEGEVVSQTDTTITLRFEGGQVTFEKKLVSSIRKAPLPEPRKPERPKEDAPKAEAPRSDGPRFAPTSPVAPDPGAAKPAATKPAETNPAGTKPSATKPVESKPADGKPADGKPVDGKPSDVKPIDGKPAGGKPSDVKPTDGKPVEMGAVSLAAGIRPAKDDWSLLWNADRRSGWCRIQTKIEETGKSIFDVEMTVLGKDGKPEGIRRYVEEAGPGYAPLGFVTSLESEGKHWSRSVHVRNGRLIVETWEDGEKSLRESEVPEGLRFVLAARAMVLREAGETGASWKGTTVHPTTGELAACKVSLLRRERFQFEGADIDTVVLSRRLGDEATEERVSADGRVLAAAVGADGVSVVGTTAARVEALRTSSLEEEASESEKRGRMALACPEDGFRIRKPGVSWVLVPAENRNARERAAVRDFSGIVGVVVAADPAPEGPEPLPEDLGAALEKRLAKESATYRRIESGAAPLGGSPGWRVVADTERNGDEVRVMVVTLARGGRVYTVTATAPRGSFAEARPFLQRILDGIEWL